MKKLIYKIVLVLLCLAMTSTVVAQEVSDREIGFDVARITQSLQERGITDPVMVNKEITMMREMQKIQYAEMKKREETILKKIKSEQNAKNSTGKSTAVTDIPQSEKDALKALYDATGGANWKNKTGWDFNTVVTSWDSVAKTGWYGVTVADGHVIHLQLLNNNLVGTIPKELGDLKNLTYLILDSNILTGRIFDSIINLTNLTYLSIAFNKLDGSIPNDIYKLTNLSHFVVRNNQFTGEIPDRISDLLELNYFDLAANQFTGRIPYQIGTLKKLFFINLSINKLDGGIPSELGDLENLSILSLWSNALTGSIPERIGNLKKLTYFYVNNNLLEEIIPNVKLLEPFNYSVPSNVSNNKFRFIDLARNFSTLNFVPNFAYSPQAKINVPETLTKGTGQSIDFKMYADGDTRYLADDTYQWFKNGTAITGATSRVYTIPNLQATDAGIYICRSYHSSNPDMSSLVLEREPITLNVLNCPPVTGTLNPSVASPAVNASTTFSLQTDAIRLTYKWTFYNDASGTSVKDGTQTTATATQSYSVAGSYLVRLEVTQTNGCNATFDKLVNVVNNCVDSYSPNRNGSINSPYPYGDWSGVILNKPTNLSFYSSSGSTSLSYQWGLLDSNNLLVASGNQAIFPITVTNAGDYKVTLRVSDAMGCSSFERDLKTRENTPCIIPISDRDGYIINPTNSEKLLVNTATVLSLSRGSSYTTAGFTYKWDLVKLSGEVVFSGNEENFTVTPTEIGDYTINLQIKDPNGCTTDYTRDYKVVDICVFTEDQTGWIGASGEYNGSNTYFVKINESKDFNLTYGGQDYSANLTYKWRLLNPSGELIQSGTNATFSSVFTIPGYYRVELETLDTITGCTKIYTKEVGCLIGNSCTEFNPESAVVKDLLKNLIKSLLLRSIKGETDAQINASATSPEFLALKPYITNGIGNTIYNYKYSKNLGNSARPYAEIIDFSFSPDRLSDIHLDFYWGISEYATYGLSDEEISNRLDYDIFIDLTQYISSNNYLISCRIDTGGKNADSAVRPKECRQESEIRYINFCPVVCATITGTIVVQTTYTASVVVDPPAKVCQQIQISGGATGQQGRYMDCQGVVRDFTLAPGEILNTCQMGEEGSGELCSSIDPIDPNPPLETSRRASKKNKNTVKK